MNKGISPLRLAALVLALASLACTIGAPAPTATPLPTNTPLPTDTPVPTAVPTDTPVPTNTPNLVATQRAEAFQTVLQAFLDKRYIATTEGSVTALDDFTDQWAQINYYDWWNKSDKTYGDFIFSAHFKWSTASSTPDTSGCGIGFGMQDNDDHYAVILDKARILFLMGRGSYSYLVGVTRGSGRMNFSNPAEADFAVAVVGQRAYVRVNSEFVEYTLSADQTSSGQFAYTILSGTNRDYGTRCEMTDVFLWTPK
jgi:hypothetical protein